MPFVINLFSPEFSLADTLSNTILSQARSFAA
jgi:hypothetical protein